MEDNIKLRRLLGVQQYTLNKAGGGDMKSDRRGRPECGFLDSKLGSIEGQTARLKSMSIVARPHISQKNELKLYPRTTGC